MGRTEEMKEEEIFWTTMSPWNPMFSQYFVILLRIFIDRLPSYFRLPNYFFSDAKKKKKKKKNVEAIL